MWTFAIFYVVYFIDHCDAVENSSTFERLILHRVNTWLKQQDDGNIAPEISWH